MRVWKLATCLVAMLLSAPALAQEQRGSIQGTITDSSGAGVPGVTVEARSPALIGTAISITDGTGSFRFPALPPGTYEISAMLTGFKPAKSENLELLLGQVKQVDLSLQLASLAETVQVTAASPVIDVKQNAAGANLQKEFLDRIPRGRDFTSIVNLAPGASNESKAGGISIDGASGAENRYVIDGIATTDIQYGFAGKKLVTDFLDEVQVKSSGYNAEFGGSTGGTINIITRSGSNRWSGDVGTYFSGSKVSGDGYFDGVGRPAITQMIASHTLRISPNNNTVAEYLDYTKDDFRRWEPILTTGGPIVKDRVWFFAGYVPELLSIDRTVKFDVDGTTGTFNRDEKRHDFTGNVSAEFTPQLRGKFAVNIDYYRRNGHLPAIDGTGDPSVNYAALGTRQPNNTFSGNLDYVARNNLYFGVRGGYFKYDQHDIGIPREIWYTFQQGNIGFPGVPANLQRQRLFSNLLDNRGTDNDLYTRAGFTFDTTYYAKLAGEHTFKGGVQFDRYGNDVLFGNLAPYVDLYWGVPYSTLDNRSVTGPFGYYVWSQFQTIGAVHSNVVGLFVQDSWTLNRRFTINAGVRTEREDVPSYNEAFPGIKFGFGDKLAPRLGFAYDLMGDAKWKLYGSFGLFYDIMKLEAARGSFGADRWIEHAYTLDSPNWTAINPTTSSLPGRFIEDNDLRHVSNDPNHPEDGVVDPRMKPMKSREFTLGLDRELSGNTSVGVRYVRKQVLRAIEDQGVLTPGVGEVYAISNIGYGPVPVTQTGVDVAKALGRPLPDPRMPRAVRDYDGVEFRLRRRFANNFALSTSYVWSRLYGNYPGLASSDEIHRNLGGARVSPNVNRLFDLVIMGYDEHGNVVLGPLPTDHPNQFKAQITYTALFGTTFAANQFLSQGSPVSSRVDVNARDTGIFVDGRGNLGRMGIYSQTDLFVQHELRLAGGNRVALGITVTNLWNQLTALDKFQFEIQRGQSVVIPEDDFFKGFNADQLIATQKRLRDPRFGQDFSFQVPRAIRFDLKYIF